MTIKEVAQLTGLSYDTLLGWSTDKREVYAKLVGFLKVSDRSALQNVFEASNLSGLALGLSLGEVSESTGLSHPTLLGWSCGKRDGYVRLAKFLQTCDKSRLETWFLGQE